MCRSGQLFNGLTVEKRPCCSKHDSGALGQVPGCACCRAGGSFTPEGVADVLIPRLSSLTSSYYILELLAVRAMIQSHYSCLLRQ